MPTPRCWAQCEVDATSNEVAQFQPLLDGLDLAGMVLTADALHAQRDHARFLVERAADLLVVKANRPTLRAQLASPPWRQIPVLDRTCEHAHGRVEIRSLKVAAVAGWVPARRPGDPGHPPRPRAGQPPPAHRHRLRRHQPDHVPGKPPAWPNGCAGIGASRRCTTSATSLCRGRLQRAHRQAPRALASLRNLAIGALRLSGHANIATALRRNGRDPTRPLVLLGTATT
jgi:predicted transposase YbfD/YdcC